jgi:hypothetical protein
MWDSGVKSVKVHGKKRQQTTMVSSVDDATHEFCTLQKTWLETELHAGK